MTISVDPEIAAFLLDEDDLQLAVGFVPGYDPDDPTCGVCGEREALGALVGVAAVGVTGRLCADCAEAAGPLGAALVDLVDGLESIASAVFRPDVSRHDLLALTVRALHWMNDASDRGSTRANTAAFVNRLVDEGKMIRLAGGQAVMAERFDPRVHVRAEDEFTDEGAVIRPGHPLRPLRQSGALA